MARKARTWEPAGRDTTAWGCIVTVQNDDGQTLSLHRTGKEALNECLDIALQLDRSFKVLSISTPITIFNDLEMRIPNPHTKAIQCPELQKLGRVGRLSMLHPSLRGKSDEAGRAARRRGERW
jgi:hypothetical protein